MHVDWVVPDQGLTACQLQEACQSNKESPLFQAMNRERIAVSGMVFTQCLESI